jgi:hypothetical protein
MQNGSHHKGASCANQKRAWRWRGGVATKDDNTSKHLGLIKFDVKHALTLKPAQQADANND